MVRWRQLQLWDVLISFWIWYLRVSPGGGGGNGLVGAGGGGGGERIATGEGGGMVGEGRGSGHDEGVGWGLTGRSSRKVQAAGAVLAVVIAENLVPAVAEDACSSSSTSRRSMRLCSSSRRRDEDDGRCRSIWDMAELRRAAAVGG